MSWGRATFILFMLSCVALMLTLGVWQVKRLHWKEGLIAQVDGVYAKEPAPTPVDPTRISTLAQGEFLRGTFKGAVQDGAFRLKGLIDDGKPSEHLMVPFKLSDTLSVLIDMGPGEYKIENGRNITVSGLLKSAPRPNAFTPDNDSTRGIWYSIDPVQLNTPHLQPLVIIPEHTPWHDFPARKPEFRNDHLQYAIFWFVMAAIISALTVYFSLRGQKHK